MNSSPTHLPSRPRTILQTHGLQTHGPQLVPRRTPQPSPRHSPLALWHLFSLDAPTVAALWTLFIARCSHVNLPWTAPAAMFAAVWMIYAADRLLDARILDLNAPHHPDLEARHRFHHHHRARFLTALLLAAVTLTALLHSIDARALHLYALLATLLAAWMLLIHIRPTPTTATRRLPKELAVGIFFPAAVFIPTLARTSPTPHTLHALGWTAILLRPDYLPAALLFASICTLNCLCLYAWEHPAPRRQPNSRHASLQARAEAGVSPSAASGVQAHWTTGWATDHLTQLALAILTASTLAAVLSLPLSASTTSLPAAACALSAAALLILHQLRNRFSPIHLRAAADLVLLTPLLLLPFAR